MRAVLKPRSWAVVLGLALGLALVPASPAYAQTVACNDITGLKTAINNANTAGSGTITLAANCVYTLTTVDNTSLANGSNGLPVITGDITITGLNTTIERSSAMATPQFRIFEIAGPLGRLTLNQITLRNGQAEPGFGGGAVLVQSLGTFVLNNGGVTTNRATSGGGIVNNGTTTLTGSTVSANTAANSGGGIQNNAGTLTAQASTVTGNTATTGAGGGLFNAAIANITGSSLVGNTAGTDGGAIANNGTLTLGNSNVVSNTAGNRGGGIFNDGGTVSFNVGAVVANRVVNAGSQGGGLFNNAGTTNLNTVPVAANSAVADGGGIYEAGGAVTLASSPVVVNTPNNCRPVGTVPGCVN